MQIANLATKHLGTPGFTSYDFAFCPDLIVEVTSICDRACAGCYAANIVSRKSKEETYHKFPQMFLAGDDLKRAVSKIDLAGKTVALRGGEPGRHPMLHTLLRVVFDSNCKSIFVETHGRWLLHDSDLRLMEVLKQTDSIIKISFDKMHGTTSDELKQMTDTLQANGIKYKIAITEKDKAAFLETRNLCPWIYDHEIIYQKKASKESELPSPDIGIINCAGVLSGRLNIQKKFRGYS